MAALLGKLSSERSSTVLVDLATALGNTDELVEPQVIVDALKDRQVHAIQRVLHGLRLLRENHYRQGLIEAIEALLLSRQNNTALDQVSMAGTA